MLSFLWHVKLSGRAISVERILLNRKVRIRLTICASDTVGSSWFELMKPCLAMCIVLLVCATSRFYFFFLFDSNIILGF